MDFTKQIVQTATEIPSAGTIPMRRQKTHGDTLNARKEFCFAHIIALIADTIT